MIKVRVCPNCNTYNPLNNRVCRNCEGEIDLDCEIITVNSLDEKPKEFTKESENKESEIKNSDTVKCPICGCENDFDELFCYNCNACLKREDSAHTQMRIKNSVTRETNVEVVNYFNDSANAKSKTQYELVSESNERIELKFKNQYFYIGYEYTQIESIRYNNYISSIHCVFYLIDNTLYVQDVSSNGTFLNGEKLKRGMLYQIKVNDRIKLYNINMVLKQI